MGLDRVDTSMVCYLEEFNASHLSTTYVGWLNDPLLMRYSEQRHAHHDMESCSRYVESFSNSANLLYAVIDSSSKEHVGNINAYIDQFNQTADVGVLISKGGRGYGFAAWSRMLELLFTKPLDVRKVTGGAMAENLGMIRIFEKSGMSYEYSKIRHFRLDDRFCDMEVYYIEKPI